MIVQWRKSKSTLSSKEEVSVFIQKQCLGVEELNWNSLGSLHKVYMPHVCVAICVLVPRFSLFITHHLWLVEVELMRSVKLCIVRPGTNHLDVKGAILKKMFWTVKTDAQCPVTISLRSKQTTPSPSSTKAPSIFFCKKVRRPWLPWLLPFWSNAPGANTSPHTDPLYVLPILLVIAYYCISLNALK